MYTAAVRVCDTPFFRCIMLGDNCKEVSGTSTAVLKRE